MTNDLKLTRQGVRDLGGNDVRKKKPQMVAIQQCEHKRMRECHPSVNGKPGCRHFICNDCGLSWDDAAQK